MEPKIKMFEGPTGQVQDMLREWKRKQGDRVKVTDYRMSTVWFPGEVGSHKLPCVIVTIAVMYVANEDKD